MLDLDFGRSTLTPPIRQGLDMNNWKIHIYADGADKALMLKRYHEGFVKGFTTNPTLMAKAGIRDYSKFAKELLKEIKNVPISFEVFSDEFPEMKRQAQLIAAWGQNVNVKIPITNTLGQSSIQLIRDLLDCSIKLNVTAIFTEEQLEELSNTIEIDDDIILSIFAGRIADTGVEPVPLMTDAVKLFKERPLTKILWASPREVLNIYQAERCGCHIITATDDLIRKLEFRGKDLSAFSIDTVKMFYDDAKRAGFEL